MAGVHFMHYGRYERGISRPTADALKRLAEVLAVSGDYLLGGSAEQAATVRLQDRELLQQFQEVEGLAEEDKTLVKKFLEAFLLKKRLQEMTAR